MNDPWSRLSLNLSYFQPLWGILSQIQIAAYNGPTTVAHLSALTVYRQAVGSSTV